MYQTKVLLHSNGNSQHSVKAIYRMEENICNHTSDKLLLYKIYKKLIQMYNRKMNNPMKPTTKNAKWHFSKQTYQQLKVHENMVTVMNH